MLRSILALALSIIVQAYLHAQPLPGNMANAGSGTNITDHMMIMDSRKSVERPEIAIDGTPYLSPDFSPAFIRVKRGAYSDIPARYNASDDVLEYRLKDVTYVVKPSQNISLVQFKDYSLVVDILTSRDNSFAFFIRLDSGRATLLSRKPIEYREPQAPKAIETEGKPPRYVAKQQEFYIKIGAEQPKQFSNAKKLIELLPDHRPEMDAFLSDNKISKKPDDLARLVAYYNSL